MNRSEIPRWPTVSSIVWCTTPTASRCAANRCGNNQARKEKNEHESASEKLWKSPGEERPWKSLRDFHFSHSFNNNRVDDRDHFPENPTTSVASLRRLITLLPER